MSSCFIQTGDIHTGECRSLDGYLPRHQQILTQIMDIAYNEGLPLLIAGDVIHNKTTTHDERILLFWWFSEIEKRKIPTYVIAGNHDHLYGEVTQLDCLKYMPFKYIKITTWHPDVHVIGDIGIIGIPWRGYSSEEIQRIVVEKLPVIKDKKYKVVMLHECITGVKLDNHFVVTKGTRIPNIPEITYWAIGDIHGFQKANVTNAYYSGAPGQWKFDDSIPKGVLRVDLDHPSQEPTLIPIVFKPLKTIHRVEEIGEDAYYKLVGGYDDVIKANREDMVVATEYNNEKENTVEYTKVGILDGLPEFLANKGIDQGLQKQAVSWVSNLLNLSN